jgi:hypothetical protein
MIGSLALFDDRRDALKTRLAGEASVEFGPYPAHGSLTHSHPVSPLGGGAASDGAGAGAACLAL